MKYQGATAWVSSPGEQLLPVDYRPPPFRNLPSWVWKAYAYLLLLGLAYVLLSEL